MSHLILHFDINKTIILVDSCTHKSASETINSAIASKALGFIDRSDPSFLQIQSLPELTGLRFHLQQQWTKDQIINAFILQHQRSLSESRFKNHKIQDLQDRDLPSYSSSSPCDNPSKIINYRCFLEKAYEKVDPGDAKTRKRINHAIRRELATFTADGHLGEVFKPEFQDLKGRLKVPFQKAGIEYYILPAFYQVLIDLTKKKRTFTIVFRTFGPDVTHVADELNRFCEGLHPAYSEVSFEGARTNSVNSKDSGGSCNDVFHPDLRFNFDDLSSYGSFYRTDHGAAFINGTLQQPPLNSTLDEALRFYSTEITYLNPHHEVIMSSELIKVWKHIENTMLLKPGTKAIRDCFQFWMQSNFTTAGGKLLIIDPKLDKIHHIFFDDNVKEDNLFILDVKKIDSRGHLVDMLPWDCRDIYVVKVDPVATLECSTTFIEAIALCEQNLYRIRAQDFF